MQFICPQCGGTEIAETTTCPGVQRTIKVHDDVLEFGPDRPFGGIEGIQYECVDCGWVLPVTCEAELRKWLAEDRDEFRKVYYLVLTKYTDFSESDLYKVKMVGEGTSNNLIVQTVTSPSETFSVSRELLFESPKDAVEYVMKVQTALFEKAKAVYEATMDRLTVLSDKAVKELQREQSETI